MQTKLPSGRKMKKFVSSFFVVPLTICSLLFGQIPYILAAPSASIPQDFPAPAAGTSEIGGLIFRDFNANGIIDTQEPGFTNSLGSDDITVNAYDDTNAIIGTATTDSDGTFLITGLTAGTDYRLEVVGLPSYLSAGAAHGNAGGTTSESLTSFVTAGDNDVFIGVNNPDDYCQSVDQVDLTTTCFVDGDTNDPLSTTGGRDTIVSVPYDGSAIDSQGIASETGSVWGVAYNPNLDVNYTAAVMKRHVAVGPLGEGGIYQVDAAGNVTGGITIPGMTAIVRPDLPADPLAFEGSFDPNAFAAVGTTSLGDIEFDEKTNTLYVMNLEFQRIEVITVNPATGVMTLGTPIAITDPGCNTDGGGGATGALRPYALTIHDDKLYAGVTCDASISQDGADLDAYVMRLDGATWNNVPLQVAQDHIDLDYQKEPNVAVPAITALPTTTAFIPWKSTWNDLVASALPAGFVPLPGQAAKRFFYGDVNQPLLSDIQFDNDQSIIVTIMDRSAMQIGENNWGVTSMTAPSGNQLQYEINSGGDILRSCYDYTNDRYVLEGTGAECPQTDPVGTGEEVAEYYNGETFASTIAGIGNLSHPETVSGGSELIPGQDDIVISAMDPENLISGGLIWLDNASGGKVNAQELYAGDAEDGFSGKGVGIGDIEASCKPAPLEIGNRVWYDLDNDGVQDPSEAPLAGITVELVDAGGAVVGTAVTNATGNYVFTGWDYDATDAWESTNVDNDITDHDGIVAGGIVPGADYTVRIDTTQAALTGYAITKDNGTGDATNDTHDSDGKESGDYSQYELTTADLAGANDHNADFGFFLASEPDLAVEKFVDIDGDGTYSNSEVFRSPEVLGNPDPVVFTYQITVTNESTLIEATNVTLTDIIPPGVTITATTPTTVGLVPNEVLPLTGDALVGEPLTWTFPTFAANRVEVIILTAQVSSGTDLTDFIAGFDVSNTTQNVAEITAMDQDDSDSVVDNSTQADFNGPTTGFAMLLSEDDEDAANVSVAPAIGNFVWYDLNADGIHDAAEVGIPGVTVRIYVDTGIAGPSGETAEYTAVTLGDGSYYFGDLLPNVDYYLEFDHSTAPANYFPSPVNQVGTDETDSDGSVTTGFTEVYRLSAGEVDDTVDMGYYAPLSLGNRLFIDNGDGGGNYNNGIQDGAEGGLPAGITLNLLDGLGNPVDSDLITAGVQPTTTLTLANGFYLFENLLPGDYIVEVPSQTPLDNYVSSSGNGTAPDPVDDVDADDNGSLVGTDWRSGVVTLVTDAEPTVEAGGDGGLPDTADDDSSNLTVDFGFVLIVPPTIVKAFDPTEINSGDTSTMTLTLGNDNIFDITLTSTLVDIFPPNITVANAPNIGGDCTTANVTATAGSGAVSYANGSTIPVDGCEITVDVTSTIIGTHTNTIPVGDLKTDAGDNLLEASADLLVIGPPTVSKSFSPTTITPGSTSTLTITFTNDNQTAAELTTALTDTLPGDVFVAAAPNIGGDCAIGDVTAAPGSTTVTYASGAFIPTGGCSITVNVTSTVQGTHVNTIVAGELQTDLGDYTDAASANLNTTANPSVEKAFSPNKIISGGTSTLTLTLLNGNATEATLTSEFTDALPAGVSVASVPNLGGSCTPGDISAATGATDIVYALGAKIPAGGCTIIVDVTSSTVGTHPNTIPAGELVTDLGTNTIIATDDLIVYDPPTVTKAFSPTTIAPTGTSTLTLTLTNPDATIATLTNAFTDFLPLNVTVADAPDIDGTCTAASITAVAGATSVSYASGATIPAGGNCTIIVDVTSSTAGVHTNEIEIGNLQTDHGSNVEAAIDDLTVIPLSIGNLLFIDDGAGGGVLNNGVLDGGEIGFGAGLTVELRDGDNDPIDSDLLTAGIQPTETLTDDDGFYLFTDLAPGDYRVFVPEQTGLDGYVNSTGNGVAPDPDTDTNDFDDNGTVDTGGWISSVVTLEEDLEPTAESGGNGSQDDDADDNNSNLTVDFGFYALPDLIVEKKVDADGNGVFTDVEVLPNPNQLGNPNPTTFTYQITVTNESTLVDATGVFLKDVIPPGVEVTLASETSVPVVPQTGIAADGLDLVFDLDTIAAGTAKTITLTANVSSSNFTTFLDGFDAAFSTQNTAQITAMNELDLDSVVNNGTASNYDNTATGFDPSVSEDDEDDARITVAPAIGDFVWHDENGNGIQDAGEPGISGVTVTLYTDDGSGDYDAADTQIATVNTGIDGSYFFGNLTVGQPYTLVFSHGTAPTNYVPSTPNLDVTGVADSDGRVSDGGTIAYTLVASEINGNVDQGYHDVPSVTKAYDPVRIGSEGTSTLTITLTNPNTGIAELTSALTDDLLPDVAVADSPNASTTCSPGTFTPAAGDTSIVLSAGAQIPASGSCTVTVDVTSAVQGTHNNVIAAGDLVTDLGSNPADAEADLTVDILSIGNQLFIDDGAGGGTYNNGIRDGGEIGVGAGVTVQLLNAADLSVAGTETTDSDGFYLFTDLGEGDFIIFVPDHALLTGYVSSIATFDAEADSTDKDDNGSAATGGFTSGTVTLALDGEPTVESGGVGSQDDFAADNSSNLTVDFGFVPTVSLGNLVWNDLNANGLQDGGGEVGIQGVELSLQKFDTSTGGFVAATDVFGNTVANQITDVDGLYNFTQLAPGTYRVLLEGTNFAGTLLNYAGSPGGDGDNNDNQDNTDDNGNNDGLVNPANGIMSDNIVLTVGGEPELEDAQETVADNTSDLTIDFGVFPVTPPTIAKAFAPSAIESGATSTLTITLSNPNVAATTLTGILTDTLPTGVTVASTPNIGGTCTSASVSAIAGSSTITYASGASIPAGSCTITIDVTSSTDGTHTNTIAADVLQTGFGNNADPATDDLIVSSTGVGSLGDRVWYDINADGVQDSGEPGIPGVTVTLTDSGGTTQTTTTDSGGNYIFEGLAAGDYTVTITPPTSYTQTYDLDGILNNATTYTLAANENATTIDFGYDGDFGVLGNQLFVDNNGNGTYDSGTDTNLPNITVQVFDSTGTNLLYTITTDSNGNYTQIVPFGTYVLKVDTTQAGLTAYTAVDGSNDGSENNAQTVAGYNVTVNSTDIANYTADFGFTSVATTTNTGSIGNYIWEDEDKDGKQDSGEDGIEGVKVKLEYAGADGIWDTSDDQEWETKTDDDGRYDFTGLAPGLYRIKVDDDDDDLDGFNLTNTDNYTDSITLSAGEDYDDADFGFYDESENEELAKTGTNLLLYILSAIILILLSFSVRRYLVRRRL